MAERFGDMLFEQEEIDERVCQLAIKIEENEPSGPITLMPVLTGAMPFCVDLMKHITREVRVIPCLCSKLQDSTGEVFKYHTWYSFSEVHRYQPETIILVDDLVDTGGTYACLRKEVQHSCIKNLKMCSLLTKKRPSEVFAADYVGFHCPDKFVVGYGMDYNGLYRNLPFISEFK